MGELHELDEWNEIQEIHELFRARRTYSSKNRFQHKNIADMDDVDFLTRYRLSPETVLEVLNLIEEDREPPQITLTHRNNPIPPLHQLLLALRFYSSGSFYVMVGDYGDIHKSTFAKIIKRVTEAIAKLGPQFITLPNTDEKKAAVAREFFRIARFPKVLGAIDGTHIRLFQSPGGPQAEVFRNRKGYFSLNVQIASDANLVIEDIVARWPGSAHDSNIFDNSVLKTKFENGDMGDGILLGDSGYPLRQYLITPLNDPRTPGENLFNEAHIRTRNVVERAFGVWKRRLPALTMGLRCKIPMSQRVIIATAILHNLARLRKVPLPEDPGLVEEENIVEVHGGQAYEAVHDYRRSFINYFSTL